MEPTALLDDRGRLMDPQWFLRDIVAPFLISRAALVAAGFLAITVFADHGKPGWEGPGTIRALNMWAHCDSERYLEIATRGYSYVPGMDSNVAFAPLYPLLMKGMGKMLGGGDNACLLGGLIVSNVALLAGLGYLMLLTGMDHGAAGRRAALYVLVFPSTLFLSAVYPMSLMLALAAGAFYHARRGQWWIAGILSGAAAAARPDGVLLAAALGVEYLHQRGFSLRRMGWDALWLLLAPAALGAWLGYQAWRFGDALAFSHAQTGWKAASLMEIIRVERIPLVPACVGLFVALTAASWRIVRPSYALYGTLFFLLMLSAGRYYSIIRFVLVLFPAFMVLGIWGRSRWVHLLYTIGAGILAALLMMRFALNQWVA